MQCKRNIKINSIDSLSAVSAPQLIWVCTCTWYRESWQKITSPGQLQVFWFKPGSKIDKIKVSGCDLDELSRVSVYFLKIIPMPQTVTRSVVQENFLLLPALLFQSGTQSAKEIHKKDVLSISIPRNTSEFSNELFGFWFSIYFRVCLLEFIYKTKKKKPTNQPKNYNFFSQEQVLQRKRRRENRTSFLQCFLLKL